MIEEISIRDLGVISEARLEFKPGLTVVTGETGAGKTMVLSALGLLLGERADISAIRKGQNQASVEGRWLLAASPAIEERVAEAGAEMADGELILSRSLSSEGRSKAAVCSRAASVSLLSELGEQLVVVHGQSDQVRLRSAVAQREALDQFAGADFDRSLRTYRETFETWKSLSTRLEELQTQLGNRMAEAETLRAAVDELVAANLQPNEFEELAEKATRLTHLEELRIAAEAAHEAISSQEGGTDVLALLAAAKRSLEQVAQHDPKLQDYADSIASSAIVLRETATDLASYLASLEGASATELERVQQRRAEINSLIRKYGVDFESTLAYSDSASARLLELDSSTEEIDRLVGETAACFESISAQAHALTQKRLSAAKQLEAEVSVELQALAMPGASLVVSVQEASEFGSFGKDAVSIQLSSYPGADPRPLGKGASGGELSRIMLAIEVVLAKTAVVPTFIFDEVDAGVGGAAAIEIGRRLAQLAEQAQVIVVTHLAQVAAFANHHLRVLKKSSDEYTSSDVVTLGFEDRVSELARMLSGLSESESALEHARELISLAHAN